MNAANPGAVSRPRVRKAARRIRACGVENARHCVQTWEMTSGRRFTPAHLRTAGTP
jgi:hypothetical protein